jgi:hypothetical protein
MRVTAFGAYRMKGKSAKTGNDYDMAKLVIRAPVENVVKPNMQMMGYGFVTKELDLEVEALSKFNFNFPPEGIEIDLIVGSTIEFGRLKAIITGCTKVPAIKAA